MQGHGCGLSLLFEFLVFCLSLAGRSQICAGSPSLGYESTSSVALTFGFSNELRVGLLCSIFTWMAVRISSQVCSFGLGRCWVLSFSLLTLCGSSVSLMDFQGVTFVERFRALHWDGCEVFQLWGQSWLSFRDFHWFISAMRRFAIIALYVRVRVGSEVGRVCCHWVHCVKHYMHPLIQFCLFSFWPTQERHAWCFSLKYLFDNPYQVAPRRWQSKFPFCLRLLFLFALNCRLGEAAVPGPSVFSMGVCNPSGLAAKAHLLDAQNADVRLVSETHLTAQGLRAFKVQLKALKSSLQWIAHGAPVLPRTVGSDVGQWSGVACISKFPTRLLTPTWDNSLHQTARIVCSTSFCCNVWITGVTVYGTPVGPTHPQARRTTQTLLEAGIERVLQSSGSSYISQGIGMEMPAILPQSQHSVV